MFHPSESHQVAVTGLGLVLPHGVGVGAAEAVFEGRSAVAWIPWLAGVPGATGAALAGFVPPAGTEGLDRALQFAAAAADEAWVSSGMAGRRPRSDRVAVGVSLSKGGILSMTERGGLDPAAWQASPESAARTVAARLALTGPISAQVTACASGGHALLWGATLVRRGVVDAAIVGAAEASIHPMIIGSYRRMGLLAHGGDDPATSVRPFSASRRGFAVGEGAGLLVLESADSVVARDARPLAWVRGWATGCLAADLAEMEPDGESLAQIIGLALDRAGAEPHDVDYVSAHGTATRSNDAAEARAIRRAFGRAADALSVSSTKGAHGHLLGAAAAVELVLTVLAIGRQQVPPTANLTDPDAEIGLDCTPLRPRRRPIRCAVKIASGFGGQAMGVVLGAP